MMEKITTVCKIYTILTHTVDIYMYNDMQLI